MITALLDVRNLKFGFVGYSDISLRWCTGMRSSR